MQPPRKRCRFDDGSRVAQDHVNEKHVLQARLKSRFEQIFEKYGRDFSDIGDEIDLQTGRVVVDNGHLACMSNEQDVQGHGRGSRDVEANSDESFDADLDTQSTNKGVNSVSSSPPHESSIRAGLLDNLLEPWSPRSKSADPMWDTPEIPGLNQTPAFTLNSALDVIEADSISERSQSPKRSLWALDQADQPRAHKRTPWTEADDSLLWHIRVKKSHTFKELVGVFPGRCQSTIQSRWRAISKPYLRKRGSSTRESLEIVNERIVKGTTTGTAAVLTLTDSPGTQISDELNVVSQHMGERTDAPTEKPFRREKVRSPDGTAYRSYTLSIGGAARGRELLELDQDSRNDELTDLRPSLRTARKLKARKCERQADLMVLNTDLRRAQSMYSSSEPDELAGLTRPALQLPHSTSATRSAKLEYDVPDQLAAAESCSSDKLDQALPGAHPSITSKLSQVSIKAERLNSSPITNREKRFSSVEDVSPSSFRTSLIPSPDITWPDTGGTPSKHAETSPILGFSSTVGNLPETPRTFHSLYPGYRLHEQQDESEDELASSSPITSPTRRKPTKLFKSANQLLRPQERLDKITNTIEVQGKEHAATPGSGSRFIVPGSSPQKSLHRRSLRSELQQTSDNMTATATTLRSQSSKKRKFNERHSPKTSRTSTPTYRPSNTPNKAREARNMTAAPSTPLLALVDASITDETTTVDASLEFRASRVAQASFPSRSMPRRSTYQHCSHGNQQANYTFCLRCLGDEDLESQSLHTPIGTN